jgi:4-hydroxybenzoate polyprenyltransferase
LAFSLSIIGAGLLGAALIELRALIPGVIILGVITGLALHLFERPLARALTLGLLQALYVFMGASTGSLTPAVLLLAGVFFFAMFAGRGMIDMRHFPVDEENPVQTLPKRFGIKATARMTAVCLVVRPSSLSQPGPYPDHGFHDGGGNPDLPGRDSGKPVVHLRSRAAFLPLGWICYSRR